MGKSIHGMRARSRDRARAHHNGRVSSRLFLAGCSPAEPASASPADATLRLHPPQCQRNFIERYFVTVLVVSAQGSTAPVVLGTRLFIVPRLGALPTLHVYVRSFAEVFADDLRTAAEGLYGKPLRVFLRFAALVLPSFRGGDGELCDGRTLLAVLHLRITAEISDQHYFLHLLLLLCGLTHNVRMAGQHKQQLRLIVSP